MTTPTDAELDALVKAMIVLADDMERSATAEWDEHENVRASVSTITALRAELAAERAKVEALLEALAWCSGSQDFQVEGAARIGWEKLCAPLLKGATK